MNYIICLFYRILSLITRVFGKNKAYIKFKEKYKFYKTKTNAYKKKKLLMDIEYLKSYIMFKEKHNVTIPIDACGCGNVYVLDKIKVGDILREWGGKLYKLNEVSPYKYLETKDKEIYKNYVKKHEKAHKDNLERRKIKTNRKIEEVWTHEKMDNTFESIKKHGYDPSKCCICIDENNIILDGQHRSCCILFLHGKDYVIDVCRVKNI